MFDAAVNHGIGNAVRFLQRAVGVADDGSVGKVTLDAIKALPVTDALARFNAEHLDFYTKLTTFDTFGKGWVRRVADNLRYVAEDA
ncbi:putative Peptidoglycan domain protein [compost metagenome]